LLAALLIGPFEAFAQSDSNITSVPSKKNKKKRGSSRAKKAVPASQSEAPAPSGEMALPLPQAPMEGPAAQVAPAAPPAPAVEVASANPTPQQPSFASTMPSTVELVPEREHRGLLMIAPKAGLFKSTTALEAAFYSGIELGLTTPLFNHHFAMVFELDWVPPHYSGTIADPRVPSGSGAFALRQSEWGFLLSAVYRFDDALPRLTPYVGAGPGLYYQRASLTAFDSVNVESETKLGFQLLAGVDYQLGPGALFGEVRYHFSKVDFVGTGNVNVGGFLALGVGYRFRFL